MGRRVVKRVSLIWVVVVVLVAVVFAIIPLSVGAQTTAGAASATARVASSTAGVASPVVRVTSAPAPSAVVPAAAPRTGGGGPANNHIAGPIISAGAHEDDR